MNRRGLLALLGAGAATAPLLGKTLSFAKTDDGLLIPMSRPVMETIEVPDVLAADNDEYLSIPIKSIRSWEVNNYMPTIRTTTLDAIDEQYMSLARHIRVRMELDCTPAMATSIHNAFARSFPR